MSEGQHQGWKQQVREFSQCIAGTWTNDLEHILIFKKQKFAEMKLSLSGSQGQMFQLTEFV